MLNSCSVMARVVADPEVFAKGDNLVTRYRLVSDSDAKGQEPTYILVKSFGQNAAYVKDHFQKGDLVVVEGRLVNECYKKNEEKTYSTLIYTNRVYLAKKKGAAAASPECEVEPGKVRTGGQIQSEKPAEPEATTSYMEASFPDLPDELLMR